MSHPTFRISARFAAALAVPMLLVGCASTQQLDGGAAPESTIIVDNSSNAISEATVYLVPENGQRERLGTVTLGERETFALSNPAGFEHYLVLDVAGSDDLRSRPFTLAIGDAVEWDLELNQIRRVGSASGG